MPVGNAIVLGLVQRVREPGSESTDDEGGLGLPLVPVGVSREAFRLDLSRALHRFGFFGSLTIEDDEVVVRSPRGVVRRRLPDWAGDFERLPSSEREPLVHPFARSITEEARSSLPPSSGSARRSGLPLRAIATSAAALLLVAGGVYFILRPGEPSAAKRAVAGEAGPSPGPSTDELCLRETTALRGGAAFENVALRVFEPELYLVNASPGEPIDTTLGFQSAFVKSGPGYEWRERELLPDLPNDVRVERIEWAAKPTPTRALRVAFSPRTSPLVLSPATNRGFLERLGRLAADLEVTAAAFFGRCAASPDPCFVSWIYGADEVTAEAAWLYFVGATGPAPMLAAPFLHPPSERTLDSSFALRRLLEKTRSGSETSLPRTRTDLFTTTRLDLGITITPRGAARDARLATRERLIALGLAPRTGE